MKNIAQILAEVGLEITDDQRQAIEKGVIENYRTIADYESKTKRISELETQVSEYAESIGKLEGDAEELTALREKVSEFERAEESRKAEAEESERMSRFATAFDKAVGERDENAGNAFAKDLVRDSVLGKVMEMCERSPETGINDAIDAVTKDIEGIWRNPNRQPHGMPGGVKMTKEQVEERDRKTLVDKLFG